MILFNHETLKWKMIFEKKNSLLRVTILVRRILK